MNSLKENEKVNFGQQRISGFGLRLRPNPRPSAWTSDTRQLLSEMLWDKI